MNTSVQTAIVLGTALLISCNKPVPPDDDVNGDGVGVATSTRAGTTDSPVWFEEVAAKSGLSFVHESGARPDRRYISEMMVGGAALFDMDADGDVDLYLTQSGNAEDPLAITAPDHLYENLGDGTFARVPLDMPGVRGMSAGVTVGDYDNDGDGDVYVTRIGRNTLLRNDGNGIFTDVTENAGVGDSGFGASAAFADIDLDGDLDLYAVNYIRWSAETELECYGVNNAVDYCSPNSYDAPAQDTLYRNNGDGTFTDISVQAGLDARYGNGLGIVAGDFNGDGLPDFFIANDGREDQLWINLGDGVFEDRGRVLGIAVDNDGIAKAGMGVDAVDYDDDGDLDVLVVNLRNESDSFLTNEGSYFRDSTARAGLTRASRLLTRFGMGFKDFNNDGWLDLYEAAGRVKLHSDILSDDPYAEPNLLLVGGPDGRLRTTVPESGVDPDLVFTSRGAAFGDIDNDGGVDIVIVNRDAPASLLRNVVPNRGNWISLRVKNEHGAEALGAIVEAKLGDRTITRSVRCAYSYCSSNDPRVHLGLGEANRVDSLIIR